jgi:hypothetical protein
MTATHTFCANCGISLKALPKVRGAAARGSFGGRLAPPVALRRGRRRLLAYAAGLGTLGGVAVAVAAIAAPPPPKAQCRPGAPCGAPPIFAHAISTLPGYTPWQSSGLGFSLRYPSQDWSVASSGTNDVELQSADGNGLLLVTATPTTQASPAALMSAQVDSLGGQLLGLSSDPAPSDQLLGTNVGFVPGPGGVYTATIASPQGPQAPVAIAIVAAAQNGVTVAATAIGPADDPSARQVVYQQADDIINSIRWP